MASNICYYMFYCFVHIHMLSYGLETPQDKHIYFACVSYICYGHFCRLINWLYDNPKLLTPVSS